VRESATAGDSQPNKEGDGKLLGAMREHADAGVKAAGVMAFEADGCTAAASSAECAASFAVAAGEEMDAGGNGGAEPHAGVDAAQMDEAYNPYASTTGLPPVQPLSMEEVQRLGSFEGIEASSTAEEQAAAFAEEIVNRKFDPRTLRSSTPRQVVDSVFIGSSTSFNSASAAIALADLGVTHVLNITTQLPNPQLPPGEPPFVCQRIGLPDAPSSPLHAYFEGGARFIRTALDGDGVVLIACSSGGSRAAALLLYYLMRVEAMRLKVALATVRAAHPGALPNMGFMQRLLECESRLFADEMPSLTVDEYRWIFLETMARGDEGAAPAISREGMVHFLSSARDHLKALRP